MAADKQVLVVDDSRVARLMIRSIVSGVHPEWAITEAGDGDSALERLGETDFDLVILDYNMPGMDGLEVAAKMRERNPDVAISMLTANIQDSIQQKAAQLGVGFAKKPITEDKIRDILARFGG